MTLITSVLETIDSTLTNVELNSWEENIRFLELKLLMLQIYLNF